MDRATIRSGSRPFRARGRRPRPAVAARRTGAALLVLAAAAAGLGAGGAGRALRGRPLAEALETFRARGLTLVYSSAVVGDDLVVTVEPASPDPREALGEILAPLGLVAREGPAGSLVIAPRPRRADGSPIPLPDFTTDVVVTPGRYALLDEDRETPRVLTPADLVRVPNIGSDVSRMVERLPGIAAADNSAAFHARGSLERDTSVVLDGLELYVPFHLPAFQAPFSLVDARVAQAVELRNGGFTAERGDRHGAFVDVTTVTPAERIGEVEVGTLHTRLSWGAPVRRGAGSVLATARAWYPESFLDTLELGAGERLRPRFEDVYLKGGFAPRPGTLLSAHLLLARDRLRWEERGETDPETVDAETESAYAWVRWLASSGRGITTETVLSGGRIDLGREGIAAPDDGSVSLSDERETTFFGLSEDVVVPVGRSQRFRAGASARRLSAEYRYAAAGLEDPGDATTFASSPRGTSWGAYASHRVRVSPSLAVEAGVRWDLQEHTDDHQIAPRLHLAWRNERAGEVRVALGRYAQSQRIHELRVEDGESSFLPAEVALQAEATYLRELPAGVRLRVDAYARRIDDVRPRWENPFQPLDLFPETSEDRVAVTPSRARLAGLEILVSGDPERDLLWSASYTRSSAEDHIDGSWVPRSWDQPHAGTFVLGYRRDDAWLLSVAGSVHSGWPTTPLTATGVEQPDGSIEIETEAGPRNSARLPTYARLDLKVRRSFALRAGRLSLTVDVLNVTDRANVCCVDDLIVGEPVAGPVASRPEYTSWLGITPTFNVRWEF